MPRTAAILLALAALAAQAPAAGALPARLVGTEWERIPTDAPVVALTFDAGGDAAGVDRILYVLDRRHVEATFFLTGSWTRAHARRARRIARGYAVGNHTDRHRHLTALPSAAVGLEIGRAWRSIRDVTGLDAHPLLRVPYGESDARVLAVANGRGYASFRWTIDTLGWKGRAAGITARGIVRRVVDDARPGTIVLMHVGAAPDGTTLDATAIDGIVVGLRARGLRPITLNDAIALTR